MTDIKKLREALSKMHARACDDTSQVYMSIPADPQRDADLLLSAALDELEELRSKHAALEAEERRRTERILAFGEAAQKLLGGDLGDWRQVRFDGVLSKLNEKLNELTEARRKLEEASRTVTTGATPLLVMAIDEPSDRPRSVPWDTFEAGMAHARAAMAEEAARTIDERVPYLRTCLGSLLKSDRESRLDYERQIARHEELAADIRALAPLPASVRCMSVKTLERVLPVFSAYLNGPHMFTGESEAQDLAALAELEQERP